MPLCSPFFIESFDQSQKNIVSLTWQLFSSSISWIPGREIPGNIFEHDDNLSLLSSPDKNKSRDYSVDARMREIIEHNPLECEAVS